MDTRGQGILDGLYGALLVAIASALYAMVMAVWGSASLFHRHDFFARRKSQPDRRPREAHL
jgi:hypothetical protein